MFLSLFLLIGIPFLLKYFENNRFIKFLSPIAICYVSGIAIALLDLPINKNLVESVSYGSIALSISLLVLNSRIDSFRKLIKPLLTAFFSGIAAIVVITIVVYFSFAHQLEDGANIMGMLTGVYVGGTPNLNAIGAALGVSEDTIALVNTAEIIFGAIYFLLLITVIKPLLSLFLPSYQTSNLDLGIQKGEKIGFSSILVNVLKGLFSAIICLGLSYGIIYFFDASTSLPALLIALTSISFILGQTKPIKKVKMKFETADFLLLVFSVGVGAQIDLQQVINQAGEVYLVVALIFFGAILLHYLLAKLLDIDVDTLIIASTAALYGPPFIIPVAKAIKNKELIFYGISLGLLGYVLGNYLGLIVAFLLK